MPAINNVKMNSTIDMASDSISSALKFLCGEEVPVCRLCIAVINSEIESVSIEDSVTLQRNYFDGTISFIEMFQELGITAENLLPNVMCMSCALKTIDTFLFQKYTQNSHAKWMEIIEEFENVVPYLDKLNNGAKTLYIMPANSETPWVTCNRPLKKKSIKSAVIQVKNTVLNRKKYLKQKFFIRTCKMCSKTFDNLEALRMHLKAIHMVKEIKKYSCTQCIKSFYKPENLSNHIDRVHKSKIIPCIACSKKFANKKLLEVHIKLHHTPVECSLCSIQLPSKYALLRHSELHTKMKCPNCSKNFTSKNGFQDHVLQICGQEKSETFSCDICHKSFLRKNSVRNHLKVEHGFGRVYSCEFCNKKFAAISSLKQHEVKHTKEKKFSCDLCGGLFVTFAALTYHTRIHTGEKPYPCDICGERFLSSSRRMAHKYAKHLGPHKPCKICPSKFLSSHQLKKHMERHYNPKSKLFVAHLNDNVSSIHIAEDYNLNEVN